MYHVKKQEIKDATPGSGKDILKDKDGIPQSAQHIENQENYWGDKAWGSPASPKQDGEAPTGEGKLEEGMEGRVQGAAGAGR